MGLAPSPPPLHKTRRIVQDRWILRLTGVGHDSFIYGTWLIHIWLIHVWDMTHSYTRSLNFQIDWCGTWLIHVCDMTHSYMWHGAFICETWPIHICDMTYSCEVIYWYVGLICVMYFIDIWDLSVSSDSLIDWTYSCDWIHWYVKLIRVKQFIDMWDLFVWCDLLLYFFVWWDSLYVGRIRVTWLVDILICVKWSIDMWDGFVWSD